jgi:glycosyltransferase involved in cell wall biosynthesis
MLKIDFMNILFITVSYPPIVCSGNRIYYLSRELSKNHNVTVMYRKNNRWLFPIPEDHTFPKIKSIKEIKFKLNDSLYLIPVTILYKLKLLSNTKFYFKSIKRIIDKDLSFSKCDLVIASGPSWDSYKAAEYLYDKYKIPFILDYRDPWICRTKKDLLIQKRIVNKSIALVTVTHKYSKQIKLITNYKKNIYLIENGVDLSFFTGKSNTKDSNFLKIGYAGSFVSYQNIDVLIKAVSILPKEIKSKVILEFCGKYNSVDNINLAKNLGVRANFHGHLNISNMKDVLKDCDLLYIGHSVENAVGGKLYIYLALNKPILCYTKRNSQLDLEIKKYGFGFISYNYKELSKSIQNLFENKNQINKKNKKIKNYIVNFDWKVLSKKYNDLIKELKI